MLAVIITVVVSLALSAFFSGMEIAFLSSNKLKLEIEKKQSRAFGYVAGLFSKYPGQYITTILVGNLLIADERIDPTVARPERTDPRQRRVLRDRNAGIDADHHLHGRIHPEGGRTPEPEFLL